MDTFVSLYPSPIGLLTLTSDGESLTGLWFERQRQSSDKAIHHHETGGDLTSLPVFAATTQWLNQYFGGGKPEIGLLPLSPQGTDFQQRVWDLLRTIPYGETTSYGAIARQLPSSARAVGMAVGRNPIGIIIPCHRVIGANGQLTGFAGGLESKTWLLEHEKRGRSPF